MYPDDYIELFFYVCISIILAYILLIFIFRIQIIGKKAEIEQLRKDIDNIVEIISEDIAGQAVELNREISRYKRYNKFWLTAPLVPNEWESIEYIKISKKCNENKE